MEQNDLTERSEALDHKIADSPLNVNVLVRAGEATIKLVRLLVFLVIFVLFLGLGVLLVAIQSNNTSQKANDLAKDVEKNSQNTHDSCIAGNEFRSNQKEVLTKVINIFIPEPVRSDPKVVPALKEIRTVLDEGFAPRQCPPELDK